MSGAAEPLAGYVLHLRPYRESGALCELLTRERGRLSVVAHGTRGRRGAPSLLAFNLLAVQVAGRGELKTLRKAETLEHRWLEGTALAAGMYLNELLVRLLPREDPHDVLFAAYAEALSGLEAATPGGAGVARALRTFERTLLEELGYGVPLDLDHRGEPIVAHGRYRLEPAQGFVPDPIGAFPGATLLAILDDAVDDPEVARIARRLFNALLAPHLDGRPLRSRVLLDGARHGAAVLAGQGPATGADGPAVRE